MKKFLILCGVVLCCICVALFWAWRDYESYLTSPSEITKNTVFSLKKGWNFNRLVSELEVKGLIDKTHYLKVYGRVSKTSGQIKAGEYLLEAGITPLELMDVLTYGRSINYSFTIVEGSTFKQLQASLSKVDNLVDDLAGLSGDKLLKQLEINYEHPEGLFLAETYSYERNTKTSELLKRAHKLLQKTLSTEWNGKQKELPYKNPYESLIMASIVEKETARADERPIIAGVFNRRLKTGMRLQTDPTVIYGMGDRYKGNIRRSDLRKPTPYNTYVIPALPPTPIAMVGREAIRAALNPAPGKALFFVAKGDGSHYFSETLKEHNRAVQQYQINRRKDYRSSP